MFERVTFSLQDQTKEPVFRSYIEEEKTRDHELTLADIGKRRMAIVKQGYIDPKSQEASKASEQPVELSHLNFSKDIVQVEENKIRSRLGKVKERDGNVKQEFGRKSNIKIETARAIEGMSQLSTSPLNDPKRLQLQFSKATQN